jgi:TolB protein
LRFFPKATKNILEIKKMNGRTFGRGIVVVVALFVIGLAGCASQQKTDVTITVASSTLQNVTRVTDNRFRKSSVRISPDGTKLLYCEANETDPGVTLYLDDFRIMLLRDINISAKTPLVNDPSYGPVWFDDNSGFAYVAYEGSGSKLVKSTIAGGGKTYITRTSVGDSDANPSVRRDTILCDTLVGGVRQLVSLKDNGTEITILGEGEQPSWHPDGTKFVFIRRTQEQRGNTKYYPSSVYEMDITNNQVTQIYAAVINEADGISESCSRPSYSADGRYILFSKGVDVHLATIATKTETRGGFVGKLLTGVKKRSKINVSERRLHLFLMNADGTNLTQLTSGNVDVFSPAWGTNNDIFFISNVQDATEIWKAHLNL